jgi:DNA-binding LytR/AlgR family response regulator
MRIAIIEDEKPAARSLERALLLADPSMVILASLGSVAAAVAWLRTHSEPDLIFMDIALTDGLSFTIFDQHPLACPVIFTTAYDEYWQEAFEHNGIDYLLKPIRSEKLAATLAKYDSLRRHFKPPAELAAFKRRHLLKTGSSYVSLKTEEIAYCYATHKQVCLVDVQGRRFILDKSLSDMEKELDPAQFFRINRKYTVHINAIRNIRSCGRGKLQVDLVPSVKDEILISSEQVPAFKQWAAS